MALSHGLAQDGTPPDQLSTSATVTFVPGTGITKIALTVRGTVPGIDADAFLAKAEGGKGELPGLEGARERPRDHARRRAGRTEARRGRPLTGPRGPARGRSEPGPYDV